MLKTGDTFESGGKTWRVLGVDKPKMNQKFLSATASELCVLTAVLQPSEPFHRIIVEEVIPEWITPTDEHAKQRPECEVRDYEGEAWQKGRTLIRVRDGDSMSSKFLTDTNDCAVATWKHCRIRNPEFKEQTC